MNDGCCDAVNAFNSPIDTFQLPLLVVYSVWFTVESITLTLNALKSDGVIAPALLLGNDSLLSTNKACFDIADILLYYF